MRFQANTSRTTDTEKVERAERIGSRGKKSELFHETGSVLFLSCHEII